MSDIVERLRKKARFGIGSGEHYGDLLNEAAAGIERLQAALRRAGTEIRSLPGDDVSVGTDAVLREIDAALSGKGEP